MKKNLLPFVLLFCSFSLFSQTAGTLTFKVTTVKTGVISNSAHIQAIWIKNSAGTYVNTLLAYNNNQGNVDHLKLWAPSRVIPTYTNALTGATTSTYGVLTETWNGKNASNVVVADGTYTIWAELAVDASGGETSGSWSFAKGPNAVNTTGTATTNLTNVSIVWAPVNTAINDVEMEKYYNVYPNPAVSSIYVSGNDVKEVLICSLTGQSLLYCKEQNVNISSLAKGNYLAVIRTTNGTVVKKIQKL
ncbi:MAG: DUF2271 domain-containing protein [Paludibacter sp.]